MAELLISIITPSYNDVALLPGCVESVAAQSGEGGTAWHGPPPGEEPAPPIHLLGDQAGEEAAAAASAPHALAPAGPACATAEHLVFDNCSTDGSREWLQQHSSVRWKAELDLGPGHAVTKGIRAARGEVIGWLNTNERYLPGTLNAIRECFADPFVMVVYGDTEEIPAGSDEGCVRVRSRFEHREDLLFWWEERVRVPSCAVFMRKSVAEACGGPRDGLHYTVADEWWWRIAGEYKFRHLDRVLARRIVRPGDELARAERRWTERAQVFEPLLHEAMPKAKLQHVWERRRVQGARWLAMAEQEQENAPLTALRLLSRSAAENPLNAFGKPWWRSAVDAGKVIGKRVRSALPWKS